MGLTVTEAQRRAVVDAFRSAAAAGKPRPECYYAAIAALQAFFPLEDPKVVAGEAVRIITHDPGFSIEP